MMRGTLLVRVVVALAFAAAVVVVGQRALEQRAGSTHILTPAFAGVLPFEAPPLAQWATLPAPGPEVAAGAASAARTWKVPSMPAPERVVEAAPPAVSARSFVVLDFGSGEVLLERDAHRRAAPASLTKIATAVLAVERANLDGWVSIDEHIDAREMGDSSVMGLQPGDGFYLRDLLFGLMLPSGNDAALAIARHVAGSDAAFVDQMNALAERLGMADTVFVDPHGLGGGGLDPYYSEAPYRLAAPAVEEGEEHRSTAYDIALLARYAMSHPEIARVASTSHWFAQGTRVIEMYSSNRMLTRYEGADGVKNGFTEAAGRSLAASATRDGHRVIVVVLDAPLRELDTQRLFDWAFESHCWQGQDSCLVQAARE